MRFGQKLRVVDVTSDRRTIPAMRKQAQKKSEKAETRIGRK